LTQGSGPCSVVKRMIWRWCPIRSDHIRGLPVQKTHLRTLDIDLVFRRMRISQQETHSTALQCINPKDLPIPRKRVRLGPIRSRWILKCVAA
jgi:hypothetical protein